MDYRVEIGFNHTCSAMIISKGTALKICRVGSTTQARIFLRILADAVEGSLAPVTVSHYYGLEKLS